jgi:hypothetical protein
MRRRAAALVAIAVLAVGCTKLLGEYQQGVASKSGACTHDTEDQDCVSGYGCEGNHCALRCSSDTDCEPARCAEGLCTVPIGTPCEEGDYGACEPLTCETLDVSNQKVSGYCTEDAYYYPGKMCPPGYSNNGATDGLGECKKE